MNSRKFWIVTGLGILLAIGGGVAYQQISKERERLVREERVTLLKIAAWKSALEMNHSDTDQLLAEWQKVRRLAEENRSRLEIQKVGLLADTPGASRGARRDEINRQLEQIDAEEKRLEAQFKEKLAALKKEEIEMRNRAPELTKNEQ